MRISAIKAQIKRQGRYSIYVDDKYSFSLSDTALLDSKLYPGLELSEQEVADFKQMSIDDKLYGNALNYAMIRPRSTWEMEIYLRRKNASPALSQIILSKLSINRMLDDESFARSWVANRRLLKSMSKRRLLQELRQKHVAEDVARAAIDEDETDDSETLLKIVGQKRKLSRFSDDQKLMQYLARQGFGYDDIKRALRQDSEETSI